MERKTLSKYKQNCQNVTKLLMKTIPTFFKCRKNWKRAGIRIKQILEDHYLEMI